MIRIKFECWWTNSTSINDRIIKQFVNGDDMDNYVFVDSNPDYTIILGRTDFENLETKKENTIYISQEPLWSPNEPKDNLHEFCNKILIADKSHYPDYPEYIETLLPMLYAGRGENDYREEWDWSYNLINKTYNKSKIISGIVRKDYGGHYHSLSILGKSEVNYEHRTKLMEKLSNNHIIDVYGTHWEINNSNIKGEIWNKHAGLDDYRFSFGFENTIQKNYISEKFWDIILTDTIPIYLGCSNILDYIPSDNFHYLNNLDDTDILNKVEFIIGNYDYLYNMNKDSIINLKNEFYKNPKFNLWERVKKEIRYV